MMIAMPSVTLVSPSGAEFTVSSPGDFVDAVYGRGAQPKIGSVKANYDALAVAGPAPVEGELDHVTLHDLKTASSLAGQALRSTFDAWDAKPGTELAFCEIRTGVRTTTTTVNVWQDLSQYGMQIIVPPMSRPAHLRANAIMSHTVSSGVVTMRITEVSNGVDTPLTRAELGWPTGGVNGTSPFYFNCKPELRVPPGPRERTFRLQYCSGNAGTAAIETPDMSTTGSGAPIGTWQFFFEGVVR